MNREYIRSVDYHETRCRPLIALLLVACVLALLLFSMDARSEAKCGPWSDASGRWEGERSDANVLTCSSPENCKQQMQDYAKKYGADRTSGYAYMTYQSAMRCDFVKPSTCPANPAPRTQQCPAGYTGTWTQVATTGAPPDCTVTWAPTTPPAGSCTAIEQPTETWTRACNEREDCRLPSVPRTVRYGTDGAWRPYLVVRTIAFECTNDAFGGDPAPGVVKRCEYSNIVPPTSGAGVASLSWTNADKNTDGTTLTNLAGTRIYYGQAPDQLSKTIQIANPQTASFVIGELGQGTWYFAVRNYTSTDIESANSQVVSKVIQ